MRIVVISALVLVAGCDGLFGLTHVHEPSAADDDASVSDTPRDSEIRFDSMTDGRMVDAFVQKTCADLGYTFSIAGVNTRYRSSGGTAKTWLAAELDCEDDSTLANFVHTHLVVLASDFEASNVYSGVLFSNAPGGFWIGLSDRVNATNFKWVTDEPTGYPPANIGSPWASGQASNGAGEDCVVDSSQVAMDDVACAETHVFVCECDNFEPKPTNY